MDDLGDMDSLVDNSDAASFEWPTASAGNSRNTLSTNRGFVARSSIEEPQPASPSPIGAHSSLGFLPDEEEGLANGIDSSPQRNNSRSLPKYMYRDYYASVETEENIKCLVSGTLFVALVVVIVVVTFVVNPQM